MKSFTALFMVHLQFEFTQGRPRGFNSYYLPILKNPLAKSTGLWFPIAHLKHQKADVLNCLLYPGPTYSRPLLKVDNPYCSRIGQLFFDFLKNFLNGFFNTLQPILYILCIKSKVISIVPFFTSIKKGVV